ncbi:MAG: hypothetical protein MSS60_06980 [Clostridiales bacterium]|nr:hypothetical protein [Clostridiales bacterium]
MKKILSIWMLACLLWGLALPVAAEETCTKTEGCTLADGHDGLCNALCSKTEGCTQYGGHTGECTVPCKRTGGCTKADGHEGLCDALCTNTEGCTQYGGHEGECTPPCTITKNCTKANGHEGLCDALCSKTAGCILFGGHEGECQSLTSASVLNSLLSDKEALIAYQLRLNPSYAGGDIILQLPESAEYADAITVGSDMDGVTLTLKGNKNTFKKGLVINGGRVSIDGIRFQRTDGRDVSIEVKKNGYDDVAIYNCVFSGAGYDFQMIKNSGQYVPTIYLNGNTFSGSTIKAALRSNTHSILGYWNVATAATPEEVWLTLDATVSNYTDTYNKKYTEIQYADPGIRSLSNAGWKIYFIPNATFTTAYAAHEGEQIVGERLAKYNSDNYYKIFVNDNGKYVIVEDNAPTLKDGMVVISKSQAEHLSRATVKCTFKAAEAAFNNKTVPSSMSSDGYLTFTLKTPNGDGTYNVKEVTTTVTKTTTKAVTKTTTKTTSRSYKYTYQDYYLVTPAGFANGMRYVKDNLVTLDCTQAGKKPISLPVASMAEAAEKGYSVLVKTKDAELTLDAAALKSLAQQAKGTTVLLHYKSLNHKTLTTVGQASIQSHLSQFPGDSADLAFLVTATSDSETIEDLQKGTVTLKIPFIVLPGTEEMENRVYALQSESLSEARETAVADGYLTTTLLDLTEHMVFQVGEPVETTEETTEATVETTVETTPETTQPETEPETTAPTEPVETPKKSGGLIIGLGLVLVSLCGVAGFPFLRKRFQK